MPHFHHSVPGYNGVYGLTARTGREMVLLVLGQDARLIGHYTGRMWMRGKLENTELPPYGLRWNATYSWVHL